MSSGVMPVRPLLRAMAKRNAEGGIELHAADGVYDVEAVDGMSEQQLLAVLDHLDGQTDSSELPRLVGVDADRLAGVIGPAVAMGLVDDLGRPAARSGLAALSRVEDVLNRLVDELVFNGPFWRAVTERPETLPHSVFHGFGLENWFFLHHETRFDAPITSYPASAAIRAMGQEFFYEEHRHDDIVVRAFLPLGITKEQLLRARPLPTTTALINLLSWWSRTDPLFFMATVGILEGRLDSESVDAGGAVVYDSFLAACDRAGLDPDFVGPLRAHAKVNASHDHGSVSRELFAEVAGVDEGAEQRWLGKTHLFVETYAAFFNGILDYYGRPEHELLRVPTLGED